MAVSVAELATRARTHLGDWGGFSTTVAAQVGAADVTATLANTNSGFIRPQRQCVINLETLEVLSTGNPMDVRRAQRGTTAAVHAVGSLVLFEPRFTNQQILDALNEAVIALAGRAPKAVEVATDHAAQDVEEYALPATCISLQKVELERSTTGLFRVCHEYEYQPGANRVRILVAPAAGRHIRFTYEAAYAALTWSTSDVSTDLPLRYHPFLLDYAEGELVTKEALSKLAVVASATGDNADPRSALIAGQTMRQQAIAKLNAVAPATTIIQRRSARAYRL